MMKQGICVLALAACVALVGCDHSQRIPPVQMAGDDWTFIQLTDNESWDGEADIDGDTVVWVSREMWDQSPDIYLYDGQTTSALTTDGKENRNPRISEGCVVWRTEGDFVDANGQTRQVPHLKYYDGQTARPIPGSAEATSYDIFGPRVAWEGRDAAGKPAIFLYDGERTRLITETIAANCFPTVSADYVVWRDWDGTRWRIHLFDGQSTRQLSEDRGTCYSPSISGQCVTWASARPGEDANIFYYDGLTVRQLTENGAGGARLPRANGPRVVWTGFDENDWEVFVFDGQSVRQITSNDHDDRDPHIGEDFIAWTAHILPTKEGCEAYLYDGKATTRLTNNTQADFAGSVSGPALLLRHHDGNDWEIALAVPRGYDEPAGTVEGPQNQPISAALTERADKQ